MVHGFPPDTWAGTEVYTLGLARGLAARGHEVAVFTRTPAGPDGPADFSVEEGTFEELRVWRMTHRLEHPDLRASYVQPAAEAAFAALAKANATCEHDLVDAYIADDVVENCPAGEEERCKIRLQAAESALAAKRAALEESAKANAEAARLAKRAEEDAVAAKSAAVRLSDEAEASLKTARADASAARADAKRTRDALDVVDAAKRRLQAATAEERELETAVEKASRRAVTAALERRVGKDVVAGATTTRSSSGSGGGRKRAESQRL